MSGSKLSAGLLQRIVGHERKDEWSNHECIPALKLCRSGNSPLKVKVIVVQPDRLHVLNQFLALTKIEYLFRTDNGETGQALGEMDLHADGGGIHAGQGAAVENGEAHGFWAA